MQSVQSGQTAGGKASKSAVSFLPPMASGPAVAAAAAAAATTHPTDGAAVVAAGASARRSPSPNSERASSPLPQYSARTGTSGPYCMRSLIALVPRTHIVDYSYLDIASLETAHEHEPRTGALFAPPRLSGKAAAGSVGSGNANQMQQKQHNNQQAPHTDLFFPSGHGRTNRTDDGFVVMRAKEETYAFKEIGGDNVISRDKDMQRFVIDADGNLVEKKQTAEEIAQEASLRPKYMCSTLRLNNNKLGAESMLRFPATVTNLLHRPHLYLTVVDLSCNSIKQLPSSWDGFIIHTLLLHQNAIDSMREVNKIQGLFATLKKLTLNGNPLQSTRRYKLAVLNALPFLDSFDDVRVTRSDRQVLDTFESIFVAVRNRGKSKNLLDASVKARLENRSAATPTPLRLPRLPAAVTSAAGGVSSVMVGSTAARGGERRSRSVSVLGDHLK